MPCWSTSELDLIWGTSKKQGNTTYAGSMYWMGQKQTVLYNLQVVNTYLVTHCKCLMYCSCTPSWPPRHTSNQWITSVQPLYRTYSIHGFTETKKFSTQVKFTVLLAFFFSCPSIGVGTGGGAGRSWPPTFRKLTLKIARKVITHSLINHIINVHTVYTTPLASTCYEKLKTIGRGNLEHGVTWNVTETIKLPASKWM